MGYKGNDACLAKVASDEPIFVLRAQDATAPDAVMSWLAGAVRAGMNPDGAKARDTLAVVMRMQQWQREHSAKVPD